MEPSGNNNTTVIQRLKTKTKQKATQKEQQEKKETEDKWDR